MSCQTNVLSDAPVDSDELGGGHERLAQALSGLIAGSAEGLTIGLAGPWGSGKSTVVKLLQKQLEQSVADGAQLQCCVFVFNAWRHEGDPLRRTFLETLVQSLKDCTWLRPSDFQADIDELAHRRERTEVSSQPVLTLWGWLGALLLLVVMPLGDALVVARAPYGPVLALAPLGGAVVLLGVYLYRQVAHWTGPNAGTSPSSSWDPEGSSLPAQLGLLVNSHRTSTRSYSLKSPNPTSLEFEALFRKVTGSVLQSPNRRLVIVMDNLDRLPDEQALGLWATMRTFTDMEALPDKESRPWVVVPFAPVKAGLTVPGFLTATSVLAGPGEAVSSVQKTFRVIFHMPLPVLSEWQGFLESVLAKAFPSHSPSDFYDVYLIYRDAGVASNPFPTPRLIKGFVNQLVAVHRIWGDSIPLVTQALYVIALADGDQEKIRDELSQGLLGLDISPSSLALIVDRDSEYLRNLAALVTNLNPSEALQIVMSPGILKALEVGDAVQIEDLRKVPGALECCREIIEAKGASWAELEPLTLLRAATALAPLGTGYSDLGLTEQSIWERLGQLVRRAGKWPPVDDEMGRAIADLMHHLRPQSAALVCDYFLHMFQDTLPLIDSSHPASDWICGTERVIEAAQDLGLSDLARRSFRVPGGPDVAIPLLNEASESCHNQTLFSYYVPGGDAKAITQELATRCGSSQYGQVELGATIALRSLRVEEDWTQLRQAIQQRLMRAQEPLQPMALESSLRALLEISTGSAEVAETFGPIAQGTSMFVHLNSITGASNPSLVATAVWLMATAGQVQPNPIQQAWQSGFNLYEQTWNNPTGDVLTELVRIARRHGDPQRLMSLYAAQPNFVRAILSGALEEDPSSISAHIDYLVNNWTLLEKIVPESTFDCIMPFLVSTDGLVDALRATTFDNSKYELCLRIVQATASDTGPVRATLLSWMIRGLSALPRDAWDLALQAGGERSLCRVVAAIATAVDGSGIGLGLPLQDALSALATRELTDISVAPIESTRVTDFAILIHALNRDNKLTFLRKTLIALIGSPAKMSTLLGWIGDEWLDNSEILAEKADDLVASIWPAALQLGDQSGLQWLVKVFCEPNGVMENCRPESLRNLRDRVREVIGKEHSESLSHVEEWHSLLTKLSVSLGEADTDQPTNESTLE